MKKNLFLRKFVKKKKTNVDHVFCKNLFFNYYIFVWRFLNLIFTTKNLWKNFLTVLIHVVICNFFFF